MLYILIGMSIFFVAMGYMVTETNAQYLLSGYNTLSDKEREKVDIKAYISYFKKFHLFLGVSLLVLGLILTYAINTTAGGIFLTMYPLMAYTYFVWNGSKYFKGLNNKWNKVGVFIVIGTLVFVICLLAFFFKEDKLTFDNKKIVIEGSYGEALIAAEIESVQLVYDFPNIRLKTNGFALGTICKGFFKTDKGEIVKLILNADNKPYILFTKTNGEKIYFSAQETPNQDILDDIKRSLPQIEHKP